MKVKLVEITEDAEKQIVRIARVSNPNNQDNPEISKLIKYCITHEHWSIFEHAHLTLEIETSRVIAAQMLRHRSFTFQEFSQRYSDPTEMGFEPIELRRQAEKDRQSSTLRIEEAAERELEEAWFSVLEEIQHLYNRMREAGVARECARFILPGCTTTRLYMTGNVRSWIHYIQLRTKPNVQTEHRAVARHAKKIFSEQMPIIALALGWIDEKGKEIVQ